MGTKDIDGPTSRQARHSNYIVDPTAQLDFLNNIQKLLSEGAVNTTYKYALLLAMADLAVEKGSDSFSEQIISLDDIVEKVISLYWGQTLPYDFYRPSGSTDELSASNRILKQRAQNDEEAKIISVILHARKIESHSLTNLMKGKGSLKRLKNDVKTTIKRYPLKLLQEGFETPFLYNPIINSGGVIKLFAGVSFCLRKFYPLIYDLIRSRWVRAVRGWNEDILGPSSDLERFLFGRQRANLNAVRDILVELQGSKCFFCRKSSSKKNEFAVDHFIPWSRYALDDMHNFVLAHAKCNSQKSDHLAAQEHYERWVERNNKFQNALVKKGLALGFLADHERTSRVAVYFYHNAFIMREKGWRSDGEFAPPFNPLQQAKS